MDLKTALLQEHSKRQNERIVKFIGDSQAGFDSLMQLLLDKDMVLGQRASWAVSECVLKHPTFLDKHLAQLLNLMARNDLHRAVRRNAIRALQFMKIPDEYLGRVTDLCLQFLRSADEAIAVKAISIKLLSGICVLYPEIKKEFLPLLDHLSTETTPAIRSCIKAAHKEMNGVLKQRPRSKLLDQ